MASTAMMALLGQRLLKESVHELGHTLDLRHCQDYRCVMASSHAVEWIDLRESTFCDACRCAGGIQSCHRQVPRSIAGYNLIRGRLRQVDIISAQSHYVIQHAR